MIEKLIGVRKTRQLARFLRQSQVTLLCLLLTIIVLRGTIGAGKFGTPEQDFIEIRNRFAARKFAVHRLNMSAVNRNDSSKPTVMLVTGSSSRCDNRLGDYYLLKSIKNKLDYCRLHGIQVFYSLEFFDAEMLGFGAKLPLIRSIMVGHPEVEFVWWMDSDALFTDMAFEVPWGRYVGYNFVVHGSERMVYEEKSSIGLNTGSFLIRNCRWSLDLIEEWSKLGASGDKVGEMLSKGRSSFEVDDQSALVHLLVKEKGKWGSKVYMENEYYLHGFWEDLVERYEEMVEKYKPGYGDHRWPLVTHFAGCKPCAKVGDYPAEKCLKQMERAFNFGDNQILRMYGFAHTSLSSTRVKRVQNDT